MFATLLNGTVLEGTPAELAAVLSGSAAASTTVPVVVESVPDTLTPATLKVEPNFLPGKWGKVEKADGSTYRRRFPTTDMLDSVFFGLASDKANVLPHSYWATKNRDGKFIFLFLDKDDVR
jgi:hypothetical protein